MRTPKTILALAMSVALTLGAVAATPATAALSINGQQAHYMREHDAQVLRSAVLDAQQQHSELEFTWDAPLSTAGRLITRAQTAMWIDGSRQFNQPAAVSRNGNTVRMVSTDPSTGMEVTRTIELRDSDVVVKVQTYNTTNAPVWIQSDLRHRSFITGTEFVGSYSDGTITASSKKPGYDIAFTPGEGHIVSGYSDEFSETLPDEGFGVQGPSGGADVQGARWFQRVESGGAFEASISIKLSPQLITQDRDEDGIPDEWERGSFTPEGSSETLDLHKWGARPDQKDLFLQLNWMKAEFSEQKCAEPGRFRDNLEKLAEATDCALANMNAYRPSKRILDELVNVFAEQGIKLHIDAGTWYHTYEADEYRGGETSFTEYPFESSITQRQREAMTETEYQKARSAEMSNVFKQYSDDLLGARDSVFHLGVIGDQMAVSDRASGRGQMPGGLFYVAFYDSMKSDDLVRNTILHEFGHNLGLMHNGSIKLDGRPQFINSSGQLQDYDYVPGYVSTMNYLYQMDSTVFGFTTEDSYSTSNWPERCFQLDPGKSCAFGDYTIGPDWKNLTFNGGGVGRAIGQITIEEPQRPEHSARELIEVAADANDGVGGFRLVDSPDKPNGLLTASANNVLHAEISNFGTKEHTFTLEARYLDQVWTQEFDVQGIGENEGKLLIDVPVTNITDYKERALPIQFTLYNQAGEAKYNQVLDVAVLDFTKDEIREVIDRLPGNASSEVKNFVEKKLEPALTETTPPTPTPSMTVTTPSTLPSEPTVPTPLATRPSQPVPTQSTPTQPKLSGHTFVAAPSRVVIPAPSPVVPTPTTTASKSTSTVTSTVTQTVSQTVTPTKTSEPTDFEPRDPMTVISIVASLVMTVAGGMIAAWGWVNANGMPKLPF